ncbi:hypothetical protein MtrunA17_Chr7g0244081 [Medicago truncatula]|uniref:RNase H type-1 domain-containing protein n=1 Tax=Medicago truncatula TaxID=3880 RepID=A0A396H2A3_MEDTR|nr:hypothetical protein MtrunA17_Chr7g0244081 [Medicago truncatula]
MIHGIISEVHLSLRLALIHSSMFPWKLRTRWNKCMISLRSISSTHTHVMREGNSVADALAKNGQGLAPFSSQYWDAPPLFVLSLLQRDSLGLSSSTLNM